MEGGAGRRGNVILMFFADRSMPWPQVPHEAELEIQKQAVFSEAAEKSKAAKAVACLSAVKLGLLFSQTFLAGRAP